MEGCPRQEDKAEVQGPLFSVSGSIAGLQVPLSLTISSYSREQIPARASAPCWVLLQWHAHPGQLLLILLRLPAPSVPWLLFVEDGLGLLILRLTV